MGRTDIRMERQTLILRRRFAAPPAAVYAAWTDSALFARWWGPESVVNEVSALDARVGGAWRVTMRMADDGAFTLSGEYLEAVPSERLVFTMDTAEHPAEWHAQLDSFRDTPSGARGGNVTGTVTLRPVETGTEMTLAQYFELPSDRDAYYRMGAPTGWGQSFDKLERLLTPTA